MMKEDDSPGQDAIGKQAQETSPDVIPSTCANLELSSIENQPAQLDAGPMEDIELSPKSNLESQIAAGQDSVVAADSNYRHLSISNAPSLSPAGRSGSGSDENEEKSSIRSIELSSEGSSARPTFEVGLTNGLRDEDRQQRSPGVVSVSSTSNTNSKLQETPEQIFDRLTTALKSGTAQNYEVVSAVTNALVNGQFDLENKFVIEQPNSITLMVQLLDRCSPTLQAEVWSVFTAIVRKCIRNLEACNNVGLITLVLERLPDVNDIIADLLIELLGVLTTYSIDVKEMKSFMKTLQAVGGKWPRHSAKLLYVLRQMPKKDGPDVFFSFSGLKGAGIALPPIKTWPYQSGWTFTTWFRMDPVNSVNFERERPYLYCFRTSKGLGYSAHFLGNSIVATAMKAKPRGFQHCFKHEFAPRKWYMVTLVHVYNRWHKSEIRFFVNGQQIDAAEMSWLMSTSDHFDRCFVGCSPEGDGESSFCGQMGALYVFSEALTMQQINSMYCLGPSYQSHFKHDNETNLPEGYKKYLFDGKLAASLMLAYCPKSCDRQLCLECSPKENPSYFVHTPHALMLQDVKVVVTHSIYSTLHSVGGIQMLLPLFGQLDCVHEKGDNSATVDYNICSTLLSVLCQLLELNANAQQQLFQNKGFLVISNMLQKSAKRHIDNAVLDTFLNTAKFLLSSPTGIPLLKQLFDHILFNPGLWIHTPAKIQLKLYSYLANEFLSNVQFYSNIRRVSSVLQMVHALKFYYWVVNPEAKSGFSAKGLDGPRPETDDIVKIRGFLLSFVRKLFMKVQGDSIPKDDELEAIFNFLTTVNEDDNLYDVLHMAMSLMAEDPAYMIPGFDRKQGVCVVLKLLASPNELIRIPALKLLGYFLCRSTSKRKQDVMGPQNLFTLLTERLLLHASHLSMATYNVLFEILCENMTPDIQYSKRLDNDLYSRFENPLILKVVANLISQSKHCDELLNVKRVFLQDLISLCSNNRDNRRTILQMSVWQEWLISMAYVYPRSEVEQNISTMVYQIFAMLLHHAVKLEYGGWRVWVDTMAIVHSKVSFEKFKLEMAKTYNIYEPQLSARELDDASVGARSGPFLQMQPGARKAALLNAAVSSDIESAVDESVHEVLQTIIDSVCKDEAAAAQRVDEVPKTQSPRTADEQALSRTLAGSIRRPRQIFQTEPQRPIYRTPEFKWSHVHIRLLSDLLLAIETDIATWKNNQAKSLIETVNSAENTIFVVNAVHMVSQLMDNLILAAGGLLPLLAAATSPNSELDIVDGTQQGLPIETAVSVLIRFVNLTDVLVFASAVNFAELEQEKNMPSGGILRQCLRLVATVAVRNCLVSRELTRLGVAGLPPLSSINGASKLNGVQNGLPSRTGGGSRTLVKQDSTRSNAQSREEAVRALIRGGLFLQGDAAEQDENNASLLAPQEGINDLENLLQEMDLSRLKAVIYRDVEETKQAQFLALAVVYFLSVLMVSRYRDILEPPPSPSPFFGTGGSQKSIPASVEKDETKQETESQISDRRRPSLVSSSASTNALNGDAADAAAEEEKARHKNDSGTSDSALRRASGDTTVSTSAIVHAKPHEGPVADEAVRRRPADEADDAETDNKQASSTAQIKPISSISTAEAPSQIAPSAAHPPGEKYGPDHLRTLEASSGAIASASLPKDRQVSLTQKLKKALDSTAPLLRELMTDFHGFLQRTLLGTHGQEIMNDNKVIATLRNQQASVVELVMLLCSQEWQTSLQKHAGLAFIELVNEGRLLAHATRDHIVRVANEADFILNRLRAEDVSKHAEFETICAQVSLNRREEERTCDHLITAARRRDAMIANRIHEKILNILTSSHGAWTQTHRKPTFWRLDVWEDDSRRRKRLLPNVYGSTHPEATLKAAMEHGASDHEIEKAREAMLAHLSARKIFSPSQMPAPHGDEILDEAEVSKLIDDKEPDVEIADPTNYSTPCRLISPGIVLPGTLSITASEMYFDVNEDDAEFQEQDNKVMKYCDNLHGRWHFTEIRAIFLRRYLLQNCALEIFLASRTAVLFAFPDHNTVKKIVQYLPRVGVGVKYGLPQSRRASLMSPRQLFKHSDMPQKWQRREISNFDYLMFLNTVAGRTFNDLNQYPVFPWILSNYEARELDLSLPSNFRDLSKPIGALNPSRKAYFEERYATWEHEKVPPFHYGTHYSTAAFVLNWLIRMEPFTTMYLTLQSGKFDHADRTFSSIAASWKSCQRDTHDVKELIPEFFYLPEMFLNMNHYKFGVQDDGHLVGDVALPPWAKSPEHFVSINRQALESELVSCQLHQWLDLIFGYKQRGPEAVRATNVFYYLTYEGAIDLNTLDDPIMKEALEGQIKNFGQTPAQLLTEPHPPRQSLLTISPMAFNPVTEDLCMILKFISNSPVVHLSANTFVQLPTPSVVSIGANLGFAINRWNNSYTGPLAMTPTFAAQSPTVTDLTTQMPNLPLTVDPLLASGSPAVVNPRRHLGELFDQRLAVKWNNFITTVDSKYIFACGYTDYSFRVVSSDYARVVQVIYGHKDVVTCLARSECNIISDCYVASGSKDCTVQLWHWNAKNQTIAGEYNVPGEAPSSRATLTGHDNEITCVVVSAEHGLVVSASKFGPVLLHTTQGDLLRCLELPNDNPNAPEAQACPTILLMSRECYVTVISDQNDVCLFTTSGRLLKTTKTEQTMQCAVLSRDGEFIVSAGDNGVVSVHRLFSLERLYAFPPCDSAIKSIAVAHNHRFILAGLASGAIVVFNIDFNRWHHDYERRYPPR